jgi:hypothetical protein
MRKNAELKSKSLLQLLDLSTQIFYALIQKQMGALLGHYLSRREFEWCGWTRLEVRAKFKNSLSICGKYSSFYALPEAIKINIAYAQGVGKADSP